MNKPPLFMLESIRSFCMVGIISLVVSILTDPAYLLPGAMFNNKMLQISQILETGTGFGCFAISLYMAMKMEVRPAESIGPLVIMTVSAFLNTIQMSLPLDAEHRTLIIGFALNAVCIRLGIMVRHAASDHCKEIAADEEIQKKIRPFRMSDLEIPQTDMPLQYPDDLKKEPNHDQQIPNS